MSHYLPFLPLEIQTSIAELRHFGVPESALDLLEQRIFKASEAKTTSLQMDIVRIEDSLATRVERIGEKLRADLQAQHGATNEMLIEVRAAQQIAHPQIAELRSVVQDIDSWQGRLNDAFESARDHAANERLRLEAKIDTLETRVVVIEEILELKPRAE